MKLTVLAASCLLVAGNSSAVLAQGKVQVFGLNFDDPDDPRLDRIEEFGSSEIRTEGGVGNSGYLSVTDAVNGAVGRIIFPDFTDGIAMESFQITADLRVGGGNNDSGRPADGFSFNLVRPDDPLFESATYAGIGSEDSLPEEGSRTGLGIGFDEWQSGGAAGDAVNEGAIEQLSCGSWNADPDNPLDCVA